MAFELSDSCEKLKLISVSVKKLSQKNRASRGLKSIVEDVKIPWICHWEVF